MSTFSGDIGPEEEDGAGWGGLVENAAERIERQQHERDLHSARLQGRLEAYAKAMTECTKPVRRENGGMGSRDCSEVRTAIDILHLATLQELMPAKASNVHNEGRAACGPSLSIAQTPGSGLST
ncbi:MAG: hypothetical protein IPK48_12080 [Gammaproteobacteria bacterium]|nr:hypothetical protein [Gammaproteobacteria bacterium]